MGDIPSRLYATPQEVNDFLLANFCEDVVERYQQEIGSVAVTTAVDELRASAESPLAGKLAAGTLFAADEIDPRTGAGHYPHKLVRTADFA